MTDPTEVDVPQPQEAPPPPPPSRPHERTGRKIAAAGLIAAVALAGFTGGLIVRDSRDNAAATDGNRTGDGTELDLGAVTVEEEEPRPLATFEVRGDHLETNGDGDGLKQRADVPWRRFTELIPADQRRMVSAFELLDADYQGGYVYQDESDHTRWVLGIGEGLGRDLDATVIHEFGHLLTLSARQVPPDPNAEASCDTYFTGEGCALSSSTFARFVERFWPPEMLDAMERIESIDDEDEYIAAQEGFYTEHADEFVTDYGVTNPGEDLAETFTEFVLRDRPSSRTVADQKIAFLWDDPAMVALRDQIRSNR